MERPACPPVSQPLRSRPDEPLTDPAGSLGRKRAGEVEHFDEFSHPLRLVLDSAPWMAASLRSTGMRPAAAAASHSRGVGSGFVVSESRQTAPPADRLEGEVHLSRGQGAPAARSYRVGSAGDLRVNTLVDEVLESGGL